MAHVQIRGGVADWYWTADLGFLVVILVDAHLAGVYSCVEFTGAVVGIGDRRLMGRGSFLIKGVLRSN